MANSQMDIKHAAVVALEALNTQWYNFTQQLSENEDEDFEEYYVNRIREVNKAQTYFRNIVRGSYDEHIVDFPTIDSGYEQKD